MGVQGDDGIPVTILSGALGAGKTTTLNHLLTNAGGREIAVLVNDMGAVNVDADLIEAEGDGITELSNGCICCDLRDDLEVSVSKLARRGDFDHLVVESSGISEPAPVGRLFTTGPASAPYRLDTLATVVNAAEFRKTLADDDVVTTEDIRRSRPGEADSEDDVRPLSELLVAQVECADVVVLNKCDLADDATIGETETLIESLNPGAQIHRTVKGGVDAGAIVDTGLFDPETISETESWQRAVEHAEGHDHEGSGVHEQAGADGHEHGAGQASEGASEHAHDPASTYGVLSFAFRSRRPLHPRRFASFLRSLPEELLRSKGLFWAAGYDDVVLRYSGVGPNHEVTVHGTWIAALPEERQETQRRLNPDTPWDEESGDRRTELVFIGRGIDEESLREDLRNCELTDAEMEADPSTFESPFPREEDGSASFGQRSE